MRSDVLDDAERTALDVREEAAPCLVQQVRLTAIRASQVCGRGACTGSQSTLVLTRADSIHDAIRRGVSVVRAAIKTCANSRGRRARWASVL